MEPKTPKVPVEKHGEYFFPDLDKIVGTAAYPVEGRKSLKQAECDARNFQMAWERGWRAREDQFRRTLKLSDED